MNLLTMLLGSFASDASVNSLSHKTGVSSSMLTKLIPLAIPILLKALTNNASSAGGAQSLLTALGQHSNKRSMAQQIDEVDEKDGEKIVHHILGKDSDQVVRALSRETGMKDEEVTRSLGAMAPALMSALSAAATSASKPAVDLSDGLDFSDLCGLFSGASTAQTQNNVSNMFGSLLGGPQQPQNNGGGLLGAPACTADAAAEAPEQWGQPAWSTSRRRPAGAAAASEQWRRPSWSASGRRPACTADAAAEAPEQWRKPSRSASGRRPAGTAGAAAEASEQRRPAGGASGRRPACTADAAAESDSGPSGYPSWRHAGRRAG